VYLCYAHAVLQVAAAAQQVCEAFEGYACCRVHSHQLAPHRITSAQTPQTHDDAAAGTQSITGATLCSYTYLSFWVLAVEHEVLASKRERQRAVALHLQQAINVSQQHHDAGLASNCLLHSAAGCGGAALTHVCVKYTPPHVYSMMLPAINCLLHTVAGCLQLCSLIHACFWIRENILMQSCCLLSTACCTPLLAAALLHHLHLRPIHPPYSFSIMLLAIKCLLQCVAACS
jgi:hypothetical protein